MDKETIELFKEGIALVKEGIGGTSKKKNKPTLNFWRRFCKHARELNEYAPKISIPVHIEEKEE